MSFEYEKLWSDELDDCEMTVGEGREAIKDLVRVIGANACFALDVGVSKFTRNDLAKMVVDCLIREHLRDQEYKCSR